MIKCHEGSIEIEGSAAAIMAETTMLLREIRGAFEKSMGEKEAKDIMHKLIEDSMMSREELEEEIKKVAKDNPKKFLEALKHLLEEM